MSIRRHRRRRNLDTTRLLGFRGRRRSRNPWSVYPEWDKVWGGEPPQPIETNLPREEAERRAEIYSRDKKLGLRRIARPDDFYKKLRNGKLRRFRRNPAPDGKAWGPSLYNPLKDKNHEFKDESHYSKAISKLYRRNPYQRNQRLRRNPWTSRDVSRHNKSCARRKRCRTKWPRVANAVLDRYGDKGKAIRIANWKTKRMGLRRLNPELLDKVECSLSNATQHTKSRFRNNPQPLYRSVFSRRYH